MYMGEACRWIASLPFEREERKGHVEQIPKHETAFLAIFAPATVRIRSIQGTTFHETCLLYLSNSCPICRFVIRSRIFDAQHATDLESRMLLHVVSNNVLNVVVKYRSTKHDMP